MTTHPDQTGQDTMALANRTTAELEVRLEQAELDGNWDRAERIEAELERRDYDESDPASPQNTRQSAAETPGTIASACAFGWGA